MLYLTIYTVILWIAAGIANTGARAIDAETYAQSVETAIAREDAEWSAMMLAELDGWHLAELDAARTNQIAVESADLIKRLSSRPAYFANAATLAHFGI